MPDYDNPFQRKREDNRLADVDGDRVSDKHNKHTRHSSKSNRDRDRIRFEKINEPRRFSDSKHSHRSDKDRYRSKDKIKMEAETEKPKETSVDLNNYVVCDSWSLDTEEKNSSSPKVDSIEKPNVGQNPKSIPLPPLDIPKDPTLDSPLQKLGKPIEKMERLQPVKDAFKFEIDDEPDDVDTYTEICTTENYTATNKKSLYDTESPTPASLFSHYEVDVSQSSSTDELNQKYNDDTFLESVINEIKQENISDDEMSQEKSFMDDYGQDTPEEASKPQGSITPELKRKSFSSNESLGRSVESGYRSTESLRSDNFSVTDSVEKDLSIEYEAAKKLMPKATMDSLETWSFVLKICQPLLFRHDRNKCYR